MNEFDHLDHFRETKDLFGDPPAESPNLKRTQKYQILQMAEQAATGRDRAT
jgi:hypothetical protein